MKFVTHSAYENELFGRNSICIFFMKYISTRKKLQWISEVWNIKICTLIQCESRSCEFFEVVLYSSNSFTFSVKIFYWIVSLYWLLFCSDSVLCDLLFLSWSDRIAPIHLLYHFYQWIFLPSTLKGELFEKSTRFDPFPIFFCCSLGKKASHWNQSCGRWASACYFHFLISF